MLVCIYTCKLVWKIVFIKKKKKNIFWNSSHAVRGHTVIERLEVADELNIFINRGFFGVNGPSQHMTAELHVILSWRQKRKRDYNYQGKKKIQLLVKTCCSCAPQSSCPVQQLHSDKPCLHTMVTFLKFESFLTLFIYQFIWEILLLVSIFNLIIINNPV